MKEWKLGFFSDKAPFLLCVLGSILFAVHLANLFPQIPLKIYWLFKSICEEAVVINKDRTWATHARVVWPAYLSHAYSTEQKINK